MTIETAAKILDPKTTLEAYAECEYYAGFNGSQKWKEDVDEACKMGAEALREEHQRDSMRCENCKFVYPTYSGLYVGCNKHNISGMCYADFCSYFEPKKEETS